MEDKLAQNNPDLERDSFRILLGQLANNYVDMFHDEIELIFQRVREKERSVRSGVLLITLGAAISFVSFMVFCFAAMIGIMPYLSPVMAILVTGGTLAFTSMLIGYLGYRQLKK